MKQVNVSLFRLMDLREVTEPIEVLVLGRPVVVVTPVLDSQPHHPPVPVGPEVAKKARAK